MGVATVLIVPGFFLIAIELILILSGYGVPTKFWLPLNDSESNSVRINHDFTHRFFPPKLAREIVPHQVALEKPENTYRIILYGESAANGDPDAAYGFGRHLEILLNDRFPGTHFEVITTAITAINSHVILPIAKDSSILDADLWILYIGNNEVIGPYGPGTVFGNESLPHVGIRANIALKKTKIGQLLGNLISSFADNEGSPTTWGGIDMFSQNLLSPQDPRRQKVHDSFIRNMNSILRLAEKNGVPVLLSTVAVNLFDCAPFASVRGDNLRKEEQDKWKRHYESAIMHGNREDWNAAKEELLLARNIDDTPADLHYKLGIVQRTLGEKDAAIESFQKARDHDALIIRTTSEWNESIRNLAASTEGPLIFVDTDAAITEQAYHLHPGRKLFYEHVHFTLEGTDAVARIMADQIFRNLPKHILSKDTGEWTKRSTIQRRLAVTVWDQQRLWQDMKARMSNPPFTNRFDNDKMLRWASAKIANLEKRISPRIDGMIYQLALQQDPQDYHLRNRLGQYLLVQEEFEAAVTQCRWITDTYPEYFGGYQDLGIALFLSGQQDEARQCFEQVLTLRPNHQGATNALKLLD